MKHYGKPFKREFKGKSSKRYYVMEYEYGKQRCRSTYQTSKALAVAVVRRWERDAIDGVIEDRSFEEAVDTWLEGKRAHISTGYYRTYRYYRNNWVKSWHNQILHTVTVGDLETYLTRLLSSGLTPVTVNNERAALRMFFRWCHNRGWVRANPAANLRKFKEPAKRVRTVPPDALRALLAEAKRESDTYYLFTSIAAYSGLRRGTVLGLCWGDINWKLRTWEIPAEKMKSKEPYYGRPIHSALFNILVSAKRRRGKVISSFKYTTWQRICRNAGLAGLTCHDLRRTFVTQCRREGLKMDQTMWLSDHRDIKTVLKIYREVTSAEVREGLNRLFPSP